MATSTVNEVLRKCDDEAHCWLLEISELSCKEDEWIPFGIEIIFTCRSSTVSSSVTWKKNCNILEAGEMNKCSYGTNYTSRTNLHACTLDANLVIKLNFLVPINEFKPICPQI